MASDHQMTVARANKSLPPAQMSKTTRQVVPAFLQKLYEMVNDPKNSDLIRWSDAGDSFFVLDHERFAHDVLGRWFKHRNFSSFVRQLNMYGFHKIPHLQQGVLKSDNETEYWNFAHPNFHRGQPDLLCLIQRKKTANQPNAEELDVRDDSPTATSAAPGQVLDVQSIVNGITAIKRHQTTISAELNELKRSNQLLWQDAMAARQRHQKQQDTVNRIVKFLAGVFGNQVNRPKGDPASPHSGVVIPRRPARFMIEDAKRDGKGIVELDNMDALEDMATPISITSFDEPTSPSSEVPAPETPKSVVSEQQEQFPTEPPAERAVTPHQSSPPMFDFDPRVQGMLNQLSHAHIQQLLGSLASQPLPDPAPPLPNPNDASTSNLSPGTSHLAPYQPPPHFDFSLPSGSGSSDDIMPLYDPSNFEAPPTEGLISFNNYDGFPQDRAERQWQQAEDIDRDVNALNTSIHHLIQTFGLDPNLLDNSAQTGGGPSGGSNPPNPLPTTSAPTDGMHTDLNSMPPSDFDFDSFLNTLPPADFNDAASTAFLDEVPSPSSTDSPMLNFRHMSPDVLTNSNSQQGISSPGNNANNNTIGQQQQQQGSTVGRKRKSDVSNMDTSSLGQFQSMMSNSLLSPQPASTPSGSKPKKRKEK